MKNFLLLGVILIGLSVYGSMQAISYISGPASCTGCHTGSYQNYSAEGSIMPPHVNKNVTCITCHSGKSMSARIDALNTVAKAKIINKTKPWLNQLFQANFSFNRSFNATRFTSLQADCEKCHPNSTLKDEMHVNNTNNIACSSCHFAHTEEKINLQAVEATKRTHKNVKCTTCHGTETEVQIPTCTKCHNPPHIKGNDLSNSVCLSCHNDAHTPTRKITFTQSIPKEFCSGCHVNEYQNLTASGSKHNSLLPSCVSCHPAHGAKMSCWDCHGDASDEFAAKHFPHQQNTCTLCHRYVSSCTDCHNPHNPFNGLPRSATNEQIGEIAKQRAQNRTISPSATRSREVEEI